MSKRRMFLKMITASLLRRKSRMLTALLSVAVGATILAGLVTVYVDVPRQMAASFRSYGANMLLMPGENTVLNQQSVDAALSLISEEKLQGASPYRYVYTEFMGNQTGEGKYSSQLRFMTAGTSFENVQKTSPYFAVEGRYPEAQREALVGKNAASTIGAKLGGSVRIAYDRTELVEIEETQTELQGSAPGYYDAEVSVTVILNSDGTIKTVAMDLSRQTPFRVAGMTTSSFTDTYGIAHAESFTDQFTGKQLPLTLSTSENDPDEYIDAVSGATASSKAVVDAVNAALPVGTQTDTQQITNTERAAMSFTVSGILETGGEEEDYIYISLRDMEAITNEKDRFDVVELSVAGSSEELNALANEISENTGLECRLVKRVTKSEASVLGKLQALVFLVTLVVLVLTMISVSTTMTAVVSERRKEIGLRKALGASDNSIRAEFLGEGLFLGLLGGAIGALLGYVFALVVSRQVFGSDLQFNFALVPATIIVSMLVSALSCLIPVKRAVAIDPALVLKGE
ncbi:MAG: FtsX-like permease family protein [Clostridia bacterium]|nr:FtsX-like permease family protein [Clostridia bacterium]